MEKFVRNIIILFYIWIVAIIFTTLLTVEERVEPKGWEPPPIPQCDEPLWERIRNGCPDSSDG